MWRWASKNPVTSSYGVVPRSGSPVTFTSISGNVAQPSADSNAMAPAAQS